MDRSGDMEAILYFIGLLISKLVSWGKEDESSALRNTIAFIVFSLIVAFTVICMIFVLSSA